ncbi:AraC family transcriptional regulator [Azotosporobacter soli]|uniref:AraC family transcriptional regulator n=1 Tax=Azotosporobacter soli TaxID=3055040 RepID=UPI0031FEB433
MHSSTQQEQVKFWVLPQLNNLELLHASYTKHSFAKHMHEGFALGVIERGALAFSYRGEKVIAPAGHINLVIPGEAHDGSAASSSGWTYRMFYLTPSLMAQAAYEVSGQLKAPPFFSAGALRDDALAAAIRNLHLLLENPAVPLLEQESLLLALLSRFILRHAKERLPLERVSRENLLVSRARHYLEDMYARNISIKELSALCNLSAFHLIRVFKDCVGVPPHVYLKQVRIRRAKELLAQGLPATFVAQEVGFVDQSHFSKQFKQITGISPGKYSNIVQALLPRNDRME